MESNENKTTNLMFKIFYIVLILGIIFGFHVFLTNRYTIYLVNEEMILNEGDIGQIELLPKNMDLYDLNNYRFKSSNKDIIFVDDSGLVQGIKEGNAKVKVRYKFGLLSQKVNIKVEKVNVSSIKLDNDIEIEKNSTKRIKPLINNDEHINSTLNYSTNDDSVLKVDSLGNITGLKVGTAKLIVSASNGIEEETNVKVVESNSAVEEIRFVDDFVKLSEGETRKLRLDIYPSNASSEDILFTSSNSQIISVDSDGYVTASKKGYSVIEARTSKGLVAHTVVLCDEVEYDDTESIVVSENSIIMYVGEERKLNRQIVPPSDAERKMYLISEDSEIVSVKTGNLVAKKVGSTIVNIKTDNEDINASVNVTVKEIKNEVEKLEINNDNNLSVYVNDEIRLSASILPENSTNKKIKWTSSDESIARVSSTGIVIGLKRGSVKITAESHNGKKDSVNLVVRSESNDLLEGLAGAITEVAEIGSSIRMNETNITVNEGMSKKLVVFSGEEDIHPSLLTWSSNNANIVKVDSDGLVTAISKGTATISANVNGKEATSTVTVTDPILKSIDISSKCKLELRDDGNYQINMTMSDVCTINTTFGEEVSNKNLKYSVRRETIGAIVDFTDGVIKPLKLGQALVAIRPESNMNLAKKIVVNVYDPKLTNVVINEPNSLYFKIGDKYKIKSVFEPSNYNNQTILASVISGKDTILNGYSDNTFNLQVEGEAIIYVYPQANPNFGKKIKLIVGHGFVNDCAKLKVYESKDFKSQITNKTRKITTHVCLDNIKPMLQNFAVSDDYVYGSSPIHAWCTPKASKSDAETISAYGKNVPCLEVNSKNYISDSSARITARYVGGNYVIKIDRKNGLMVSKKMVEFAGHGQSFDVTKDNKLYINYFSNTDLTNNGRIGGGSTGIGLIDGLKNGVDNQAIYPISAIKISNDGTLTKFKPAEERDATSQADFNTKVLKLSTDNPMYFPQIAVDESKDRIVIMKYKKTSKGNRTVFTYNIPKFIEAKNSGTSTIYEYRRYIGKVCGLPASPIDCGGQGMEVLGKYIYTVQDYTYNGVKYANISKIDFDSCPKEDVNNKKCTRVENFFLKKDKYVDKSIPGLKDIEVEGISINNGKIYVSLFFKYNDSSYYKSNVVLVDGL